MRLPLDRGRRQAPTARGAVRTSRIFARASASPERILLKRLAFLTLLIAAVVLALWLDRAGLRDAVDGEISFADVVYFTAVTVTTVGYGDIVPVTDRARAIDAILLTPARLMIWLIFLGTAYELVLHRWLENRRMQRLQQSMQQHLVICGYGHSGQSAALEAVARGTPPAQILVLDRDESRLRQAADDGFVGFRGDATREQDLRDAGIDDAQAVLICLGNDAAAVLAVLTVRQVHTSIRVICNVSEAENIKLIRQAGANAIVTPSIVGGYLMADSLQSSNIVDYLSDLMRADGRVRLSERAPHAHELGLDLRELRPGLGLRLYRDGQPVGPWQGEDSRIRAGDVLLIVEANAVPD